MAAKWHNGKEKPQTPGIYECEWKDGVGCGGVWFNFFDGTTWHDGALKPFDFLRERNDPMPAEELIRWREQVPNAKDQADAA